VIKTYVNVGIGMWCAKATVQLIACPHVGDTIDVKGITVTCERVHITRKEVFVEQTVRFSSEEDASQYFD
jgi:hypothetical protein